MVRTIEGRGLDVILRDLKTNVSGMKRFDSQNARRITKDCFAGNQRGRSTVGRDADILEGAGQGQEGICRTEPDTEGAEVDGGFRDRRAAEGGDCGLNEFDVRLLVLGDFLRDGQSRTGQPGDFRSASCCPEAPEPVTVIPIWEMVWPVVATV